jgi:hypothetical protein
MKITVLAVALADWLVGRRHAKQKQAEQRAAQRQASR